MTGTSNKICCTNVGKKKVPVDCAHIVVSERANETSNPLSLSPQYQTINQVGAGEVKLSPCFG